MDLQLQNFLLSIFIIKYIKFIGDIFFICRYFIEKNITNLYFYLILYIFSVYANLCFSTIIVLYLNGCVIYNNIPSISVHIYVVCLGLVLNVIALLKTFIFFYYISHVILYLIWKYYIYIYMYLHLPFTNSDKSDMNLWFLNFSLHIFRIWILILNKMHPDKVIEREEHIPLSD